MNKVIILRVLAPIIFVFVVFSAVFAGELTLPFNGNYRVSAYYDLDPTKGKAKGYNGGKAYDGHTGTDYATPNGTPILAMNEGKIVAVLSNFSYWDTKEKKFVENTWATYKAGDSKARQQAGNYVIIEHLDGTKTSYLHLQKGTVSLKVGDKVKKR